MLKESDSSKEFENVYIMKIFKGRRLLCTY